MSEDLSSVVVDDVGALRLEVAQLRAEVADLRTMVHGEVNPTLSTHDRRIGSLEAALPLLLCDGAETKAAVLEVRDLLRQFAPAMNSVSLVIRSLDMRPIDPDPTPNQRGGG